jgi:hypothetical protein
LASHFSCHVSRAQNRLNKRSVLAREMPRSALFVVVELRPDVRHELDCLQLLECPASDVSVAPSSSR